MATQKELEDRRMEAVEMLRAGYTQTAVAFRLGVSKGAVSTWNKKWKEQGKRSLKMNPHPGAACKLTAQQKEELCDLLDGGALACGFESDDWTCPKVQQLIQERFSVSYHVDHVGKLLRGLGFTPQRPRHQSSKRDPEAIKSWRRKQWPRIKKGA